MVVCRYNTRVQVLQVLQVLQPRGWRRGWASGEGGAGLGGRRGAKDSPSGAHIAGPPCSTITRAS